MKGCNRVAAPAIHGRIRPVVLSDHRALQAPLKMRREVLPEVPIWDRMDVRALL